jgi:hypothetical protein
MKPSKSILDESFAYVPSAATSVAATWRRFGWQPISEEERRQRSHAAASEPGQAPVALKLAA